MPAAVLHLLIFVDAVLACCWVLRPVRAVMSVARRGHRLPRFVIAHRVMSIWLAGGRYILLHLLPHSCSVCVTLTVRGKMPVPTLDGRCTGTAARDWLTNLIHR